MLETIPLRRGRGVIAFHASGFRHPGHLSRERFTSYGDVTHLVAGRRGLRIGTRASVFVLPWSWFVARAGAERAQRLLVERIAAEPDGALQLARFAELDRRAREQRRAPLVLVVALVCVAMHALSSWLGPELAFAGFFSRTLVEAGEWWRVITANLLHANALHLATNAIVIAAIGGLVERPLGAPRTLFVIALSALASMGVGLVVGYEMALGASGVAAGLVGAALWLELRSAERLPAQWRLPRRWLVGAIALEAVTSLGVTFVAGAAHGAGFAAGIFAAALVARAGLREEPPRAWLALADALFFAAVLLSLGALARETSGSPAVLARRGERLLAIRDLDPQLLNNTAWALATTDAPNDEQLAVAERLAARAAAATHHSDPNVLDTLAEVLFQRGDAERALDTIDRAIELAPGVSYFVEQRHRFRGERARDDRPDPPNDGSEPGPQLRPEPFDEDDALPKWHRAPRSAPGDDDDEGEDGEEQDEGDDLSV